MTGPEHLSAFARHPSTLTDSFPPTPYLVILGTLQDGGAPHAGCTRPCCRDLYEHPDPGKKVVSIGLVDPSAQKKFLIEATPDFPEQLWMLSSAAGSDDRIIPDGILLTHAHIGHYTGLMFLGKEAMNTSEVPVYAMPRMKYFLEENGPWRQLVAQKNIALHEISDRAAISLTPSITITPFTVPHRDEFSETVGYLIEGPRKKAVFIPDIDKWEKWQTSIADLIRNVDFAFLDGTFYDSPEINYRDIAAIPHPFVIESFRALDTLPAREKEKVHFIHLNHTNPLLIPGSQQQAELEKRGYQVATLGALFEL